ncbi:olfactory receptor 11A1-like [Brienomyrus brachyistius]|uniref:olfactory receptor 11A1-like n=1 Tax=Brienomyrus brachyistius TaxID=42636 RepID=UPI0020B2010B|nr:olfactory receptor 11A1-like [Brienomyrus brachyistius]
MENVTAQRVTEFTLTGSDHLPNQRLLGTLILVTYLFILLGSSANICVVASDRRLFTPMYIFICNLAAVDITFTTSAGTTLIGLLLLGIRNISYQECISRMFIYHMGDICLSLTLTLMAVDRVVAISSPLHYHSILTNGRTLALIAFTWLLAIVIMGLLVRIVTSLPYCQPLLRYSFCDYATLVRAACVDPEPYFIYTTILVTWLISVHLPLILATYVKIIYTVLRLSKNESRKQMVNTCVSHVIVVTCYFLPKFIVILLTRVGVTLNLTERNALLIVSTLIPSFMNPTVYCLRTKEIRTRLIKILTRNRVNAIK